MDFESDNLYLKLYIYLSGSVYILLQYLMVKYQFNAYLGIL